MKINYYLQYFLKDMQRLVDPVMTPFLGQVRWERSSWSGGRLQTDLR